MKRIACIYMITNLINGHRYIGSTIDFHKRQNEHVRGLKYGKHCNDHLQKAWNKYGPVAFKASIISVVDNSDDLLPIEQAWIDGFSPEYNICSVSGSTRGTKRSEATCKKLSQIASMRIGPLNSRYGKSVSAERRLHQSIIMTGKKWSPEARNKLSEIRKGRTLPKRTEAYKLAMSRALKGRIISPETRLKMSISHNTKIKSPEYLASISTARRLKILNKSNNLVPTTTQNAT